MTTLSHASERLDPPLIDVYVRGGFRKGDVNDPEARAILQEIQTILADSSLDGRTIGVVTLLGTDQAAHIHKLVTTHISPVDVVKRQIAIGPPPVFQGRERDIMLVSMVLAPGDHSAQNRSDQNQRFNVALSRARDREYLFRSVDYTAFADDTLNGRLIRHFREPFRQDAHSSNVLRERCESDFERDMFDELVKRGYRVEPQVRCGGFRIDFVVEGREGRRISTFSQTSLRWACHGKVPAPKYRHQTNPEANRQADDHFHERRKVEQMSHNDGAPAARAATA